MAEVIAGIPELIERGKKFTYENFSSKSDYGYPNAYSDERLVWTHSVIGIAAQIGQSPIGNSIARGLGIENDRERSGKI